MSMVSESTQLSLFPSIKPKYLIDTNCLIKPYNDYYAPGFALSQSFWNRLKTLTENGVIGVLDRVYDEAYGGHNSDQLNAWLDAVAPYAIDSDSNDYIVAGFQKVIQTISNPTNGYQSRAIRDWDDIKVADPWLIGAASQFQSTIITFERSQNINDRPWKHLKIPTIANMLGVRCVNLFTFMNEVGEF